MVALTPKLTVVENPDDGIPSKVAPSDPIMQSVDINTKPTSYVGAARASTKELPKEISNFRPNNRLGNNSVKHGLKRIRMNNKGFFFFKFDSQAGLEAVLEGGPLDDTVVSPFIITSNVVTPTVEKTNDGFQTVGKKKKRKGKSKSTNGGQFVVPSVKPNVSYEPKATSAPKKGAIYVGNASKLSTMLKSTDSKCEMCYELCSIIPEVQDGDKRCSYPVMFLRLFEVTARNE
nr:zinc knuckle CX2CX4HX4C [Tanacetum cinerariifolium]